MMAAAGSLLNGDWRSRLAEKLDLPMVQHALISLILINALILGLETSQTVMQAWGPWLVAAIIATSIVLSLKKDAKKRQPV